jgi:hypothetical protein
VTWHILLPCPGGRRCFIGPSLIRGMDNRELLSDANRRGPTAPVSVFRVLQARNPNPGGATWARWTRPRCQPLLLAGMHAQSRPTITLSDRPRDPNSEELCSTRRHHCPRLGRRLLLLEPGRTHSGTDPCEERPSRCTGQPPALHSGQCRYQCRRRVQVGSSHGAVPDPSATNGYP